MAISISDDRRAAILARAHALGFDAAGIAAPDSVREAGVRLGRFLDHGRHGDMGWMAANRERRADPRVLWPEVASIIVVGVNYAADSDPLAALSDGAKGAFSVYARRRDYHDVIKKRLKQLGRWICDSFGTQVKVFVDTAPVMEKPLAEAAGLGWPGKHTNLVSRDFGSWLFLGSVFTTLDLPPDRAHADHCGGCRRCLDICPTGAFVAPYQLDARRCISYLTIEHKGHIDRQFRAAIGNRVFGCDDCLAVCPWNKFARAASENALALRPELAGRDLGTLAGLDHRGFGDLFRQTPIKRLGRDRFIRNVLIAIGNSADRALLPAVEARLGDPSPLVRAMAVWALSRLAPGPLFQAARARLGDSEPDPEVRAEWAAR